ncbi:MAG: acyl-CoA dehydrogenase, partial [Actinomycetota bacterium]|nr:acyl-CoA dehydrogenase [Actinomycetota bacterium]
VGRALGAAPLCLDAAHAQAVADVQVYVRQSHAERDLAALGALEASAGR